MKTLFTLLLLGCTLYAYNQQKIYGSEISTEEYSKNLDQKFNDFSIFKIQNLHKFNLDRTENIKLELLLGSKKFKLNLYSDNVQIGDSNLKLKSPHLLNGSTFEGYPATLSINENFIFGQIKDSNEQYNIEPLWYLDSKADKNLFIFYKKSQIIDTSNHTCGVEEVQSKIEPELIQKTTDECKVVDYALANTENMFVKYGNSVQNVIDHNLGILNIVQTLYRSQFDTNLEYNIVAHYVATNASEEPQNPSYTGSNSSLILDYFESWAGPGGSSGATSGGFGVAFNNAGLWSDTDFDGTTIGLANRPGWFHIMQDISIASRRITLQAHEIGHNWNGMHDGGSNLIMSSTISSSTTWSSFSKSTISSRLETFTVQNALDDCGTISSPNAFFVKNIGGNCVCSNNSVIEFEDQSQYGATRDWIFNNANPSMSSEALISVDYSTATVGDLNYVEINSMNTAGSDLYQSYIKVDNEPPNNCFPSTPSSIWGILNVEIANVDKASTNGLVYENFACSEIINAESNTTYNLDILLNNSFNSYIKVYADWNSDGTFNNNDELLIDTFKFNGNTWNLEVTTPSNPILDKLIRFRILYGFSALGDACFNVTSGDVEDYSIYFESPQVYGCTDPTATNYNPLATIDDGSCDPPQPCDGTNLNITNITQNEYRAKNNIISDALINQDVLFGAENNITLNFPFEVLNGRVFEAKYVPCID